MKRNTQRSYPPLLDGNEQIHAGTAPLAPIVTGNEKMKELLRYAEVVARTGQPVLVLGETGVGKELVARAVHELSGLSGDFVALNAAGLDEVVFADALFGHNKGAYTGAEQVRDGLVARAAGGTLFLDEIGDLKEMSQLKLLRLLQEGEYYPGGSDYVRKSEARIVVATNCDLVKRMAEGRFRSDLYYRLCTHQLRVPPLRERKDDLPLLVDHFIAQMSRRLGVQPPTYSMQLIALLESYDFPGNVRELQGMVDDAVICSRSNVLSEEPFLRVIAAGQAPAVIEGTYPADLALQQLLEAVWGRFPTLHEAEALLIDTALKMSRGNQRIAATMLGLNRQTLNMRLKVRKH